MFPSRPHLISALRLCVRRQLATTTTAHKVVQSPIEIELPKGNLAAYVLEKASQWSSHIALECNVTGRTITYAQLVDRTARCGGLLKKMGVGRGDVVGMMMLNCPEYPIFLLGAISIGAVPTFFNSSLTTEEVSKQIVDSKIMLMVADESTWSTVGEAFKLLNRPPVPTLLNFELSSPTPQAHPNLRQLLEDESIPFADMVEVVERDTCMMPYSSGTTGNPKGVLISHGAFSSNLAMFKHPSIFTGCETTGSYQDSYLCYLPFFHIYGLVPLIAVGLRVGTRLVTIPKFDPKYFVSDLVKYKVRTIHTVPSTLNFLMQSPEVRPETVTHVKAVICSAAPVSPCVVRTFTEKLQKKIQFQEAYGMTEILVSHITPLGEDMIGSCGKVLPSVAAKVVDRETGQLLGPNQDGEIYLKSPSMMTGYFNNKEATEETITEDGWVKSGDVGHYDKHGFFSIVDRTKDLIKVKALQVSPSELEDILLQHPKVVEVGVVGVPHERLGEVPKAYVVTSSSTTEAEITDFVKSKVAPHKRLVGGVVFIKEVPKNASGKLLRRELKKMALI